MTRTILLLAIGSLAFAPAPFPKPDSSKDDLKKMQGEWAQVRFDLGGRADQVRNFTVVITGDRLRWFLDGKPFVAWSITLDGTRKPREFDARGTEGSVKGSTFLGVYRLKGEFLTICYHASQRPTGLQSDKPGVWLEVFKRVKR
jgi:uncharacterized protein (TIGR03067 family)